MDSDTTDSRRALEIRRILYLRADFVLSVPLSDRLSSEDEAEAMRGPTSAPTCITIIAAKVATDKPNCELLLTTTAV